VVQCSECWWYVLDRAGLGFKLEDGRWVDNNGWPGNGAPLGRFVGCVSGGILGNDQGWT